MSRRPSTNDKLDKLEGSVLSWLTRLWSTLTAAIIQDTPATLNACESCRETDCTDRRWQCCGRRQSEEMCAIDGGSRTPAARPC